MRSFLSIGVTVFACVGCHGGAPAVDAIVVEAQTEKRGGALRTVSGVHASLTCPDFTRQLPDLETDASGHAHFYMERRWHRGCVLTVSKEGYETQKVTLGDVCGKHEENPNADYCALATIVVVELRRGSP